MADIETGGATNNPVQGSSELGTPMQGSKTKRDAYNVYLNMVRDGGILESLYDDSRAKGDDILNSSASGSLNDDEITNLRGIWGLPYRFSDLTDIRTKGRDMYGRVFTETYVGLGNFVSIRVGKPKFMPFASSADAGKILRATNENDNEALQRQLQDSGVKQLFTFKECMREYWETVGLLCRATAIMLGISEAGAIMDDNWNLMTGNWGNYASKFLIEHAYGVPDDYSEKSSIVGQEERGIFDTFTDTAVSMAKEYGIVSEETMDKASDVKNSVVDGVNNAVSKTSKVVREKVSEWSKDANNLMGAVVFYNDGPIEVTESVANQVAPSTIAQMINGLGGQGRELAREASFMTGAQIQKSVERINSSGKAETTSASDGGLGDFLMGKAGSMVVNTSLPDVWKDTNNTKSHQLRFKFASAYGNKLSIYKSVIVPMLHAIVPALPNQQGASNTYQAPYLVNCMSRGSVNCLMGVVTGIQINRNHETLSIDGLPTEVEVIMTVQELNSMFAIPQKISTKGLLESPGLLSFLASFCGINMDDITELIPRLYLQNAKYGVTNIPTSIRQRITQKIRNIYVDTTRFMGLRSY
ncbi:MAG: hypothetical protein ACRC92_26550 [Peptostreptococcaceae bacterium]